MADGVGRSESHTLAGGEIVYLVQPPGAKWNIRRYECCHGVYMDGGMPVLRYREGLPSDWSSRRFESVEDALAFVQNEIEQGKVPRNAT